MQSQMEDQWWMELSSLSWKPACPQCGVICDEHGITKGGHAHSGGRRMSYQIEATV
jgi:hypothetical protein